MKERRGRYQAVAALDAGGWLVSNPRFHGDKPGQTRARATAFLKSFAAMGYIAVNVGAHELVLPPAELAKLAKRSRVQLISANLVGKDGKKPLFQPAVLRKVGGLKVGVFGLISANPDGYGPLVAKRQLKITDPVAAARAAVAVLRRNGADIVVCLSALRRTEVDLVAEKVRGVDVILGSTAMELSMQLSGTGKGYFADTYTKGKYVGELVLVPGDDTKAWVAADLKASLRQQEANLRQQVSNLQSQLKSASEPDSPIKLTPESRKVMQRELVRMRAKLQRVGLELEGDANVPAGAGKLRLSMSALDSKIDDEPRVLRAVDAYKKRFPSKPGH